MTQCTRRSTRAPLDQRGRSRSFSYARPTAGRRWAKRSFLFDEVYWRGNGDPKSRRGILVGISETGLALITEHRHGIHSGTLLEPKSGRGGCWCEPVVVTRVDRLSDLLDLVAAEYPDSAPNTPQATPI